MHQRSLKAIYWWASSKKDLLAFPQEAVHDAGYQLHLVQSGGDPLNFKPLPELGSGVTEIRIDEDSDTYRVIYVAKFEEAIYVLYCFQKKSKQGKQIPKQDAELIKKRYKEIERQRPAKT